MPHWFQAAFETPGEPLPCSSSFEHLLAGLTALADWIGSDAPRFEFVPELDPNYMEHARSVAAEALAAFGLDTSRQRAVRMAPATFAEVSGRATPNAQQSRRREDLMRAS
jgi:CRISPR-associated endonuclease/helicase Cas3